MESVSLDQPTEAPKGLVLIGAGYECTHFW